ncbi:hypothetical protein AGLY_003614 [Aphis glycines]|uniref:Uncharacterized protein n=1 Tax=Aphis glycines TaxID=307491 RepID=A0A6G0TYS2_APHGL|nr:hypothetical protein AGLY_003614 [Aphis glycines]
MLQFKTLGVVSNKVKSKKFLAVFFLKKLGKNHKKMTEKRDFLRKISFSQNRLYSVDKKDVGCPKNLENLIQPFEVNKVKIFNIKFSISSPWMMQDTSGVVCERYLNFSVIFKLILIISNGFQAYNPWRQTQYIHAEVIELNISIILTYTYYIFYIYIYIMCMMDCYCSNTTAIKYKYYYKRHVTIRVLRKYYRNNKYCYDCKSSINNLNNTNIE